MAQKSEQGRFARMIAFWSLFLLMAWGVLGEFRYFLKNPVLSKWFKVDTSPWTSLPLLGDFGLASLISVVALALMALVIHRFINREKISLALTETEEEMRRVTWPSWADTWAGTLAVMITVIVLLVFLFGVDAFFVKVFSWILGGGAA